MTSNENRPQLPATHSGAKPGDYPVGSMQSRGAARAIFDSRLEKQNLNRVRLVVSVIGRSASVAKCSRSRWSKGTIFEHVELDGSNTLSGAQLDRLTAEIPIDGKEYVRNLPVVWA